LRFCRWSIELAKGLLQVVVEDSAAVFLGPDPAVQWLVFRSPDRASTDALMKSLHDHIKWISMGWWRPLVMRMAHDCRHVMRNATLLQAMKVCAPQPACPLHSMICPVPHVCRSCHHSSLAPSIHDILHFVCGPFAKNSASLSPLFLVLQEWTGGGPF
jgi:hypothetical protein